EARKIMEKLGYGPDKRLSVTVTTRNVAGYRDPAVLLIDQLKEIYIDGTLNAIDTTQWYPTVMRKDYMVGLTVSENGLDDPDQQFYENFECGAERNYTGYCSPEVDKLVDQGDRTAIGGGCRAADHLLSALRGLLAPPIQGAHDDGQRQLQRLAP